MPEETAQLEGTEVARSEIERLLDEERVNEAVAHLTELHPADQAEVVGELDRDARALVLPRLSQEALAEIIDYLPEEPRTAVAESLDVALLRGVLDQVERDVAVDVLHALDAARAREVLAGMSRALELAPLLQHEDESAGGRMTSDFVALPRGWTVEQTLAHLRHWRPKADQAYYLYVVDDQQRLEGVVSLRNLVVATTEERIADLMTTDTVSVQVGEDQEEVARRIQRYNFIALPVVDSERRLVGVVNVDDLMDVVAEEATEDMYRMVGLAESESLERPIASSLLPRLSWLLVAMVSVLAAAGVVIGFEDSIERVPRLAAFMPIIGGLGGNAGVQTITLVVRSIALGQMELRDVRGVLQRELTIAIVNGMSIGLVLALIAFGVTQNIGFSIVVAVAMLLSMTTAVTAGVLVPLTLRALRLDPALAAGVVVTTSTDVLGFFFFLGLATLLIDQIG